MAIKAGLSDAEAQDVVQETVLTVAKKIGVFKSDPTIGSFKGWLLRITRRRIADHFEKCGKVGQSSSASAGGTPVLPSDDSTRTATIERVPDPVSFNLDACWEEEWQKNLLHAFGFCGHGFQLSPGVGYTLAEMIDEGAARIPIEAFAIDRFSKLNPDEERLTGDLFERYAAVGAVLVTYHGSEDFRLRRKTR